MFYTFSPFTFHFSLLYTATLSRRANRVVPSLEKRSGLLPSLRDSSRRSIAAQRRGSCVDRVWPVHREPHRAPTVQPHAAATSTPLQQLPLRKQLVAFLRRV